MNLANFPGLTAAGYEVTSPISGRYNCIAWAANQTDRDWWPEDPPRDAFWPEGVTPEPTLDAFIQAFGTLGYEPCDNSEFEPGYEKLAIYVLSDEVTHAARQLGPNEWTSKIGHSEDITHTLSGLVGPLYGAVRQFMRRATKVV